MERLTRSKAIRAKCLDCCGGQAKEVRLCPRYKCSLFAYRMGREMSPGRKDMAKVINEEKSTQNAHDFGQEGHAQLMAGS